MNGVREFQSLGAVQLKALAPTELRRGAGWGWLKARRECNARFTTEAIYFTKYGSLLCHILVKISAIREFM